MTPQERIAIALAALKQQVGLLAPHQLHVGAGPSVSVVKGESHQHTPHHKKRLCTFWLTDRPPPTPLADLRAPQQTPDSKQALQLGRRLPSRSTLSTASRRQRGSPNWSEHARAYQRRCRRREEQRRRRQRRRLHNRCNCPWAPTRRRSRGCRRRWRRSRMAAGPSC